MTFTRSFLGAAALALAVAGPVAAQDRAVRLFARSGGFNAVTNLDNAGSADFNKVGLNVGGGVGVQLHRFVTLRGDLTFARNELQTNGVDTSDRLNRFLYTVGVQLQYPTAIGLEPYAFLGGGAVTLHQVGTSGQDKTRAAGTFGLGLNYTIPHSRLGLFVEGQGWVYDLSKMNGFLSAYDKRQVEIGWSVGLSYSLPL